MCVCMRVPACMLSIPYRADPRLLTMSIKSPHRNHVTRIRTSRGHRQQATQSPGQRAQHPGRPRLPRMGGTQAEKIAERPTTSMMTPKRPPPIACPTREPACEYELWAAGRDPSPVSRIILIIGLSMPVAIVTIETKVLALSLTFPRGSEALPIALLNMSCIWKYGSKGTPYVANMWQGLWFTHAITELIRRRVDGVG